MDVNHYPLTRELGMLLKKRGLKLAAAESCTGGAFARVITRVAGASAYFNCSLVTYSNQSKMDLLGVSANSLEKHGAVSGEVAEEMALGALKRGHADIAVSFTGVAGPDGGTPEKPVGTVWICVAQKNGKSECRKVFFESGRQNIRNCAVTYALKWLSHLMQG